MGDEREEGEREKENERKQRKESKWRGRRRERVGSLAAGAALQIDLLRLACIHGWRYHKHDSCVRSFHSCRRRHRRAGSGANRLASLPACLCTHPEITGKQNWKEGGRKDVGDWLSTFLESENLYHSEDEKKLVSVA